MQKIGDSRGVQNKNTTPRRNDVFDLMQPPVVINTTLAEPKPGVFIIT